MTELLLSDYASTTPYEETVNHLAETFGDGYEEMDLDEKYSYACALVYAITDLGQGKSPEEAWESAMSIHGDGMFDENVFDDLEGRSLRMMIFSQFECVASQLRNLEREIAQAESAEAA